MDGEAEEINGSGLRKESIYCGSLKRAGHLHPSSGDDTEVSQIISCVTRGMEESDRKCEYLLCAAYIPEIVEFRMTTNV